MVWGSDEKRVQGSSVFKAFPINQEHRNQGDDSENEEEKIMVLKKRN